MKASFNLEQFNTDSDFISCDGYQTASKNLGLNYLKRDFLFKSGNWRGTQVTSIPMGLSDFLGKGLVIGHSDLMTSAKTLRVMKLLGIEFVLGVNTIPSDGFSWSLPLGLTNNCNDSPAHRILGDTRHIVRAHQSTSFPSRYDGSMYVNFTAANNRSQRSKVLDIVRSTKGAVFGETIFSETGRIRYLSSLRSNSFVVCPEGNGVDTHRLWETLYMGGVPIVQKSKYLSTLLLDLPVIQIDSWEQLKDTEFLEGEWHSIQNRSYIFDVLNLSHWKSVFQNMVG